jgi:hypothetical protein
VQPTLFGISLAGAFLIAAAAIVAASLSSNLAGLVVLSMAAVALGAAVFALMVASAAKALRRREVPGWFCYAAIAAGLVILLGANASQVRTKSKQAFQILDRVEEIRRAELAYAERHPGHAFTCNGPDLPGLAQLPWGAEEQLGRTERNRLQIDGRWIYLRCPPSAHPQAMSVIVIEPGKNALQFPVSRASPL